MNDLHELIERARWLHEQMHTLQESVEQLRNELHAYGEPAAEPSSEEPPVIALWRDQEPETEARTLQPTRQAVSGLATTVSEQDRRVTPRRRGNPVSIEIANSNAAQATFHGWVIDRSPDGLCVVSEEMVPAATTIRVRPTDLSLDARWFDVEVRNCRPERTIWILGCQFLRPLTWQELRWFS
jgi:hypothetical protein